MNGGKSGIDLLKEGLKRMLMMMMIRVTVLPYGRR